MPGPYFPNSSWAPFVYQGLTYNLTHLDEYEFAVLDTDHMTRNIAVSFSDHCFTRDPEPGDDPGLLYPNSSRPRGYFCFKRYNLSLSIRKHIAFASDGKVWTAEGDNFAVIPVVCVNGQLVEYGIFFSLDRAKGLPVDLHMRVRTAFPADDEIRTFGSVRFRHLVALRMKGKRPPRITGSHRKAPKLPRKR
jgi:hypothetical protein